jgi:uncharacterized protein with NRDE domain
VCLIAIALGVSQRYPLIVAANRDELHQRPASPAAWWGESPRILAGRDLMAGGTWLGIDERGRFAAVTNVWEAGREGQKGELSRGRLVTDYLKGQLSSAAYAAELGDRRAAFAPFNLLLLDQDRTRLVHVSNQASPSHLAAGVHVFSNTPPGVDWPKVSYARYGIEQALEPDDPAEALLELLATRSVAPRRDPDREHPRNALFIEGPEFGTRCSTVILHAADGTLRFIERRFGPDATPLGETHVRSDVQSLS